MKWLAVILFFIFLAGCASYVPVGILYTGGKMGVQANSGEAPKTGKACMTSILGLVAGGDASIEAAKDEGGIKEVEVIDYEVTNILGIYGQYCTIVRGR
ncbi:MAG: TRL-like family protein [Thermodesulfovibrionales bacterium]